VQVGWIAEERGPTCGLVMGFLCGVVENGLGWPATCMPATSPSPPDAHTALEGLPLRQQVHVGSALRLLRWLSCRTLCRFRNRLNWPDGAESKKSIKAVQVGAGQMLHCWAHFSTASCPRPTHPTVAHEWRGVANTHTSKRKHKHLRRWIQHTRPSLPPAFPPLQKLKKLRDYLRQHCEAAVKPHLDTLTGERSTPVRTSLRLDDSSGLVCSSRRLGWGA
jgi:hypothetical protein